MGLKALKVPEHIAIILDGNRRYARRQGMQIIKGHKAGARKVQQFIRWCMQSGIKEATLYVFSTENFDRPKSEVNYLMNLFKSQLESIKNNKDIVKDGIKIRFIGNLGLFDKEIEKKLYEVMDATKDNKRFVVNFAIGYGGKAEIICAMKKMYEDIKQKKISIIDVDEKTFENYLYIKDDVDLLIRPGGEKRISNFLLWQCSYAELWFSNKLWPEFSKGDFKRSLNDFSKRERRYGV